MTRRHRLPFQRNAACAGEVEPRFSVPQSDRQPRPGVGDSPAHYAPTLIPIGLDGADTITDDPATDDPQTDYGCPQRPDDTLRVVDSGLPHPMVMAFSGDKPRLSSQVRPTPAGIRVGSTWLEDDAHDEDDTVTHPQINWPDMTRELSRWCAATASAFGRSSVPAQDVLALLVHRLITDAQLSERTRSDLAMRYRLVRGYNPSDSVH